MSFDPSKIKNRNVGILASGTAAAQIIPLAISPVLTRIYTPEDFGVFALYFAIVSIFGSIATLRYELAVSLPETQEKALAVSALSALLCGVFSVVSLVVITIAGSSLISFFKIEEFGKYLFFIPLGIALIGLTNTMSYLNLRHGAYRNVAISNLARAILSSAFHIGIGLSKAGPLGLILGSIAGGLTAIATLSLSIKGRKHKWLSVTGKDIAHVAMEYRDFPKYSMWAALANSASTHAVNILISVYASFVSLGFYSLVTRTLGAPSSTIGLSFGQVFYQQASELLRTNNRITPLFNNTLIKLSILSCSGFGFLFFVIEGLFALVFGENWRLAGEFARIMIPAFAIRFITSPLSVVNSVHMENSLGLIANVVLLFLSTGSIVIAHTLNMEFRDGLKLLSTSLFTFYFLFLIVIRRRTQINDSIRERNQ